MKNKLVKITIITFLLSVIVSCGLFFSDKYGYPEIDEIFYNIELTIEEGI